MSYGKGPATVALTVFRHGGVDMEGYASQKAMIDELLLESSAWCDHAHGSREHLFALEMLHRKIKRKIEEVKRDMEAEE